MKAKIMRGAGFRGVLDYALGDGKGATIVGGNMGGADPQSLAAEFGLVRQLRPSCERPVWHCSLSSPPGERLSDEQWEAVGADMMRHVEMEGHPYVVIRHTDTELDHVHLVASRIALDGSLWHGQWEARRAIAATQRIEREHGLTLTPGLDLDEDTAPAQTPTGQGDRAPTRAELARMDRTDEAPVRLRLQEILSEVLETGQQTVFAFIDRLEAAGVTALPNVASTGKMNGFSFELDGVPMKASQLGKAYAWKALQERGVSYDQTRDGEGLRARADAIKRGAGAVGGGEPAAAPADAGAPGLEHGNRLDRSVRDDELAPGTPVGVDPARADRLGAGDHVLAGGDLEHREDLEAAREGLEVLGGADLPAGGSVPAGGAGGGVRPGLAGWRDTAELVADLAAPSDPDLLEGGAEPRELTPSHRAKLAALERQHAGLQAPAYRLTLKSRVEGRPSFNVGKGKGLEGAERFYPIEEVQRLIPYLSGRNRAGFDIYLTPIDSEYHHIVVDDLTPEREAELRTAGFAPALVQDSSAGNRQAILKVPRRDETREQSAANRLMVWLNRRFGDPNISGVIHPFRAAGFSNKKPGKGDAFTRVIEATGAICAKAAAMLETVREQMRTPSSEAPASAKPTPAPRAVLAAPELAPEGPADARWDAIRRRELGLVRSKGWTVNESALDHRTAVQMLAEGFEEAEVAGAMLRRSPGLSDRHRNAQDYVTRTMAAAAAGRRSRPEAEADDDTPKMN